MDGLRGLAAIAVMAFHFNVFYLPQANLPLVGRAYLSVDLFFIMSGYVMAHVYGHRLASDWRAHWQGFARARFARLYPLFATTTLALAALAVFVPLRTGGVSFSARALALQPPLMQQWYSGLSWDYPSWSISTEAEAYLFFVFFAGMLIGGRRPRLMAMCCVSALVGLSIAGHGRFNDFVGGAALLRTLAGFSLGVLIYREHSQGSRRSRIVAGVCCVLFATAFVLLRMDFIAVCAFCCLVYYSVDGEGALGRLLNSRPCVALGDWSYSIYLLHAPMHLAAMTAFAASGHPVDRFGAPAARLLVLGTAVVVVATAAVNWRYFEMPARTWLLRLGSRGPLAGAAVV